MHIILVSDRLATAKTLTIGLRHVVYAASGLLAVVVLLASLMSYLTVIHARELRLPLVQKLVMSVREEESRKTQAFVRENLNAMATRVGQLQAQLVRLDFLGDRVAQQAGIKPSEVHPTDKPGQGGPLLHPTSPLSATELERQLDVLSGQLQSRSDYLGLLERELVEDKARKSLLPSVLPVASQWNASSFGWRIDPFSGERAMHEGVDFTAAPGTPIVAAAGGVVIAAEYHPEYGNMVEIDHGNDLVTRYAHASKLLVKPGAIVRRGQKIAEVGSTGRSTGAHLHFEVRRKGVAQNPSRFLANAQRQLGLLQASAK